MRNLYDGVYLSEGADTEVCAQNAEGCKHNCQRFIFFAQAVFDVVHRAAGNISVSVNGTVFYCEQAFCIFGCHTEEGCNPHPEQCARAASLDSSSNTNDVTGTNSCGKCSTQSLKAVYVTTAIILSTKNQSQSLRQLENLQQLQTEGQQDAGAD